MKVGHNLYIFHLIYDIHHLRWISVRGNNSIPDHDRSNRNPLNCIRTSYKSTQSCSSMSSILWLPIAKMTQIINISLNSFSSFQALVMVLIQSIDFLQIPIYLQLEIKVVSKRQCINNYFLEQAVLFNSNDTNLNRLNI